MKKLKLFLGILFLAQIFFSYSSALAQTPPDTNNPLNTNLTYSGPEETIRQFLCTPSDNGAQKGDLYTCINKIYKFSIALASIIAVFFIVIGGYLYMSSEGNGEAVDKAKSILASSIIALVILLSAFLLLKQINPDLIKFQPIQIPKVYNPNPAGAPPWDGGPITPVTGTAINLAKQILGNNNITLATAHASGISDNATAKQNIQDTAAGKAAARSSYQGAPGTTVALNAKMLSALATIGSKIKISVSEIAGGSHPAENGKTSTLGHYGGNSFDITDFDGSRLTAGSPNIQKLMNLCKSLGAGQVIDEVASANHVHCGAF